MFETDKWKFVEAKWYQKWTEPGRRPVRVIVIHDMEFPERKDTAEVIAHDFATRLANNKGSAHICVDSDTIIQCVKDNDVAYAAPGCNRDGIQVELAGFGRQTTDQWLDEYGIEMLALGGDAVAQYCRKYEIPPVKLEDYQLFAGKQGIVGHDQVTRVYPKLAHGHTDPGPHFPWDHFIKVVAHSYEMFA